jgi:hypothetical protein
MPGSVNTSQNITYWFTNLLIVVILNGDGRHLHLKLSDQGNVGAIMLLGMSSAFDTVNHSIMLDSLLRRFGVQDEALKWLKDFLTDSSQVIHCGANQFDCQKCQICRYIKVFEVFLSIV